METLKQVVYRNDDQVIVPCPNSDKEIRLYFIPELSQQEQDICNNLKSFCETQIETSLEYVVFLSEVDMLNIQGVDNEIKELLISDLNPEDKSKVDAVGALCLEWINS